MASVLERFWQKVEIDGATVPGMTLPCWEWNAALDDRGYPRFKYEGTSMYANRALFALEGTALGQEDQVVTLCRNRRCVRPEHHIIGTESDARQLARGGPICPNYQMLVRQHVQCGEMDVDDVAMCFGVSLQVAEAVIVEGRRGRAT